MELFTEGVRTALFTLEPGDDVVDSIQKAFGSLGVESAYVTGHGEAEDVEIGVFNASGGRSAQRLKGSVDVIGLLGRIDRSGAELRVMAARHGSSGSEVVGGLLTSATAVSMFFHLSGLPAAAKQKSVGVESSRPAAVVPVPADPPAAQAQAAPVVRSQARVAAPPPLVPAAAIPAAPPETLDTLPSATREPATSPMQTPAPLITPPPPPPPVALPAPPAPNLSPAPVPGAIPIPARPQRKSVDVDNYPEENDLVNHFAFGRCIVLASDGERLKLQQEPSGKVREVAVSMLRIDPPQTLEDGRRVWPLVRKN